MDSHDCGLCPLDYPVPHVLHAEAATKRMSGVTAACRKAAAVTPDILDALKQCGCMTITVLEQFHFEIALADAEADARYGGVSAIYLRG